MNNFFHSIFRSASIARLLITATFSFFSLSIYAQVPANDACNNAVTLVSTAGCSPLSFSNTGATQSLAPIACNGFTSTIANDVWFSFVAVGSGDSVIVIPTGVFDPVVEVFSGSCTNPLSLGCSDIALSATEKVAPGFVAGNTYRVRVYGWNGAAGQFSICVKQASGPVTAPVNDACAAAISLTSSATCNAQNFSSSGATQSVNPVLCGGFTSSSAKDIWFSFVAFGSGDSVIVSPVGTFDPILEVFSGSCSSLVSIGCSDGASSASVEKVATGTLVAGQTYYARVYGWAGAVGQFGICVKRASGTTVTPANDNCNSAISLTSSATCNAQNFSSSGATQSVNPVLCGGFTSSSAKDIWFSFVAFGSGDSVIVSPVGTFDPILEIFSGSCSSLVSIGCSDGASAASIEKVATGTLVAGQTYYVRVYGWAGAVGSFSICIRQPSLNPSNDNCGTTVLLTAGTTCNPQTFSNTNATQSLPPASCGGLPVGTAQDVWFAFGAVTASDTIIVSPVGGFNPVVEVFSGTCAALNSLGCSNNTANPAAIERFAPGGLNAGILYWVRVYGFNGQQGQFTICVKRGTPAAPPSNDNCSGAIPATPVAVCTGQNYTTIGATQSQAPISCSGATSSSAKDVWFTFVASGSGDSVVVDPDGVFDAVVELFQGSNCSSLASLACSDDPVTSAATEKISTGTLTPGSTYFVRIYGWNGLDGQFSFCVKQASAVPTPSNDNCQSAITLIPSAACNSITYNNTGATQSLAPISCGGAISNIAQDVWFSFTASNAGDSIIVIPSGTFDPVLQLFGGSSCNNLVPLICSDNPGTAREIIAFGGLSVGVTYRVRVYGFAGTTGPFSICIKQPGGSAPANDNCTGSITLTPSLTCNPQTFTTLGATQSLAPTACGGIPSTSAQDVWFKFGPVLTQGDTVIVSPVGGFNPVVEFYSGLCTNLTSRACSNNPFNPAAVEKVAPGSLNLSVIYYVRVYGFNGAQGQFNICVKGAGSPGITNDNCATATEVPVLSICSGGTGTTAGASQSLDPASCNGATSTSAQDVWYKFTAVTPGDTVRVVGNFNSVVQLYSGTCSNLTSIACSNGPNAADIEVLAPGSLIPGQTYYFRVYGFNGASGNFVYCVKSASGCSSVAGIFSVSPTETVSNSLAVLNLTGSSPGASVQWQVSEDNTFWTNSGTPVTQVTDTFYITSQTTQTYYLRARVTVGTCSTANSNSAPLQVSCATPFTNKEPALSGFGISAFSFAGINNPSTSVAPSGAYQNFRLITGQACRGVSYPFTITSLQNNPSVKAIWIDYNNNGSFSEPGETVLNPVAGTGNLSGNIIIPSNASPGIVRVRVMLYSPGTSTPSINPCFAGPYAAGEIEEYSLNISASPSVSNSGTNASTCANSYTLSANAPSSGTGLWSVVSGTGTFSNANSPTATVSGLSNGANVLRWTISTACSSSVSEVTITVTGSGPTASAGTDQTVCAGEATLSANTPSPGSGLWTVVSGSGTFSNASSPNSTVSGLGIGNNVFRWTISNPGCSSTQDEVIVFRKQPPVPFAGNDQQICTNQAVMGASGAPAGTGFWSLVSGSGTILNPGDPNTLITGLGNGANVFMWTVGDSPCPVFSDQVTITTNLSAVAANAGPDQSVCGFTVQLSGNNPGTGSGTWAVVQGSGTITNPGSASTSVSGLSAGVNVFSWTITPGGGCDPTVDIVTITTFEGLASNAGPDQTVCGNTAALAANSPGSSTGLWSVVSGSGEFTNPTSSSSQVINMGSGVNVFRWTISNAPCPASSDDVSITSTPSGLTASAGPDQTVCGSTASLNALVPGNGSGSWTIVSGSASVAQSGNPASAVSGLSEGPNVFLWTVTSGACSASDQVTIVREPDLLDLGNDTLICEGSSLTLSAGGTYTVYLWSDNSSSQVLNVSQSGQYWLQVVSANGCVFNDTIGVVVIPCTGVSDNLAGAIDAFKILPNPSDGNFRIINRGSEALQTAYRIISSHGSEIYFRPAGDSDAQDFNADLSGLPSGLYLLEALSPSGRQIRKLMIR